MQPSRSTPSLTHASPPPPRHGLANAAINTTATTAEMKRQERRPRLATLAAMAIATAMLTALAVVTARSHVDTIGVTSRFLLRRREDVVDGHRRLTVFGADDRRAVSDASLYPYSAVGLLRWSADRNCTASLVGSKYALTAAECVLTKDGTQRPSSLSKPELVIGGGSATNVAHVVKIHRQSDYWTQWTQNTYVLLELDAPLGDTLGKLLLPSAEDLNQSQGKTPVQMVGFDDDVTRATATAKPELKFATCTCSFPGSFGGPQYMLHHDCDTSAVGSPGSVLLVRYTSMETYIIGIHTNLIGDDAPEVESDAALDGYSDAVANRGVLGPFVQQHLQALLKNGTMESTKAGSSSGSSAGSLAGSRVGQATSSASPSPSTPSGGERNVADSEQTSPITAGTAYLCISFVGCAWACILFIVLRHIRNRK